MTPWEEKEVQVVLESGIWDNSRDMTQTASHADLKFHPIRLEDREWIHPRLQGLEEGISEFTFSNFYLFRNRYHFLRATLDQEALLITGKDGGEDFFMFPFGLPDRELLEYLFSEYSQMKCVSEVQADNLSQMGFSIMDDRDNYDYLYHREKLADLPGRKYHKKKNLIHGFVKNFSCEARPLLDEYMEDAFEVLKQWKAGRETQGDHDAALEGLELIEKLQLCGIIYYVDEKPAAYILGEEIARGTMFVIHFEKALTQYKGLYQFVNQSFAAILPGKYEYVNREQDLGFEGLRQTKLSYRPAQFVKKFRATAG